MAHEHPFLHLFESFGRLPVAHAESVNREAYEELGLTLDEPVSGPGRCILLRAPRAGHGKTHLLSRMQHYLSATHEFIPLQAIGSRIDATTVTEDALRRLSRPLASAGGLTVLDLVVRRLFAFALQPLVASGEVPCQDKDSVLVALKTRPLETFDFNHPSAVTAQWARDNFELLGPRLSLELANRTGISIREISFWVNVFFRFASTPIEHPGRTSSLGLEATTPDVTESIAMERLVALLNLLSVLSRVVLVADELEGFSADTSAALRFAAFVTAVRQSAERVDVILSLNEDVWENAFLPRLTHGLADRLSEVLIELEPLSDEHIIELFESRVPGMGEQVLERITVSDRHARGLIRAAGKAWTKATRERQQQANLAAAAAASAAAAAALAEAPAPPEPGAIGQPDDYHEEPATPEPVHVPAPVFEAAPVSSYQPAFVPRFESVFKIATDAEIEAVQPAIAQATPADFVAEVADDSLESFIVPGSEEEEKALVAFEETGFERVPEWEMAEEPVSPAADFAAVPPVFAAAKPSTGVQEPRVGREEDGRVTDLLRQFRERYGRGGL